MDLKVFRSGDALVELIFCEGGGGELKKLTDTNINGMLVRFADIIKTKPEGIVPASVPSVVLRDMIAHPDCGMPVLTTVVATPFFSKSGELVSKAGYHASEQTYIHYPKRFSPEQLQIGIVSRDEATNIAHQVVEDLFSDFPFVRSADRVHIVAALIQPFVRAMISGPTPLYVINAPTQGTGKTLIVKVISIIASGSEPAPRVPSSDENERQRAFLAELMSGRQIILLDNLDDKRMFHSPSLAAILTSTMYSDRLIGSSKMVQVPNQATWFLTGNNPSMSGELVRRSVFSRLEPNQERPWERQGFKHPDLTRWVAQNRWALVQSILTMINSWVNAGQPAGAGKTLGSFEDWSIVMQSILQYLGYADLLANSGDFKLAADPMDELWTQFILRWHAKFGFSGVSATQLLSLADSDLPIEAIVGDGSTPSKLATLGKRLRDKHGGVFGGFKVALAEDNRKHGSTYVLLPTEGGAQ